MYSALFVLLKIISWMFKVNAFHFASQCVFTLHLFLRSIRLFFLAEMEKNAEIYLSIL